MKPIRKRDSRSGDNTTTVIPSDVLAQEDRSACGAAAEEYTRFAY